MDKTKFKYSFILPIYNPRNSLVTVLKKYKDLSYNNFELILVDDSDYNAFKELELDKLEIKNLKYFHRRKKDGLDAAFNFGISACTGEIIVMATDDNLPHKNFLNILNSIYNQGYDFVIGRSKVINSDNIFAVYQSSYENYNYNKDDYKPKWSEGFSVKKECLIEVGLYPNVGINGGNDNLLSEKLEKKFKVKRDFSLIMHHRAPETLDEFYSQQLQRGSAGPQFDYMYFKKPRIYIILKYIIKSMLFLFNFVSQFYFIYLSFLFFTNNDRKNVKYFFKILISINMRYLFHSCGEIISLKKII
jgi:glycosyltransferase involved in cell wall biosynthesis